MLHQIPLLLLFSAILMMPLRVSGMVGEEGHEKSSAPHDEHQRSEPTRESAQDTNNRARNTGVSSGTEASSSTAENPRLKEADPPQQPPANQEAVIRFLRDSLDHNPTAGRFTINAQGHLLGAEPLRDRNTVIGHNQGIGTMDRLRGILRDVGLGALTAQDIFRNLVPNQGVVRMRIGEDPLTRDRIEAIIALIENHVDLARNPRESTVQKSSSDSTGGAATGPSLRTATKENKTPASQKTSPAGSLVRHSLAAAGQNTDDPFDPDFAGTTHDGIEPEEPTSPGSIQAFDIMDFVARYLSRIESINAKIAAYEEELYQEELRQAEVKTHSPESSHCIFGLKHLIAILKKAKSYQKDMHTHLENKDYSKVGLKANLKAYLFKINESPNKIERIAHQLAVHIEELLSDQALLDIVDAKIDRYRDSDHQPPEAFLNAGQVVQERITHRRALIEEVAAYAELLPPPYEARDEATQAAIDQQALACRRELLLIRSIPADPDLHVEVCRHYARAARQHAAEEAQEPQPREQVITLLTQAADRYQQAADAYARGETVMGVDLNNAARTLARAAEEAQKPQPQEQVVTLLTQAADRHQQAADAYARGETVIGMELNNAARALARAAEEAQEPQPREQVITLLTQAADRYQQAADGSATGDTRRGYYLSQAAGALARAAEEAQKPQPREQVITLLTQASDRYQQAADAFAKGDEKSGWSLRNAADAFSSAAEEAQKRQPQAQVITLVTQLADRYQQAADAYATGHTERGDHLSQAARALARAAEEAQEPEQQ